MTALENLTLESFTGLVGQSLTLRLDDDQTRTLELIEATPRGEAAASSAAGRRPFSLVFVDSASTVAEHLPQGIYRVTHAQLGEYDLFLVPLGPSADGVGIRYEAIFT
jgi:hypothetical protein